MLVVGSCARVPALCVQVRLGETVARKGANVHSRLAELRLYREGSDLDILFCLRGISDAYLLPTRRPVRALTRESTRRGSLTGFRDTDTRHGALQLRPSRKHTRSGMRELCFLGDQGCTLSSSASPASSDSVLLAFWWGRR